jgi:hypothetical protein
MLYPEYKHVHPTDPPWMILKNPNNGTGAKVLWSGSRSAKMKMIRFDSDLSNPSRGKQRKR